MPLGDANALVSDQFDFANLDTLAASSADPVSNPVNDSPLLDNASLTLNEGESVPLGDANALVSDQFDFANLDTLETSSADPVSNPVNDPPVLDSASLTLNEGETVTLGAANFGITDPDSSSFTFKVSGVVSGGYFQLSSDPGVAIDSFTSAQLTSGLVQFVDDGNEVAPSFSVTVNDGSADSNTLAATINYTPVNDLPVLDSASLTLNEGETVTLGAANFGIADPDSSSFTFKVSGVVSGGYFQLSSDPGVAIDSFTSAQLTSGLVQFVDDGNEVAPSFSVTVNDGSADSNTLAATINYKQVSGPFEFNSSFGQDNTTGLETAQAVAQTDQTVARPLRRPIRRWPRPLPMC